MFISNILNARVDPTEAGPSCKPFTLQNSVCVGDFIAILVCGIAGIGFLFWSIHAVRKMRSEFPFTYDPEKEQEEAAAQRARDPFLNPANVDEALVVQQGVIPSPDALERVRARMILTHPGANTYYESNDVQPFVMMPRAPPPVGTPSSWTLPHSPPHYGSLYRDGPSSGENGYGVKEEYITDTRFSRAMDVPLYRPDSSYRFPGPLNGHMNGDSKMYDAHH